MVPMQPIGFLTLPAELRSHVYKYISLTEAPLSAYRGLFLACRQIHAEMESECLKNWVEWLTETNDMWKNEQAAGDLIELQMPRKFSDISHLLVNSPLLPWGMEDAPSDAYWMTQVLADFFTAVFPLHLSSFTIRHAPFAYPTDLLQTFRFETFFRRILACIVLADWESPTNVAASDRLIFDFGMEVMTENPHDLLIGDDAVLDDWVSYDDRVDWDNFSMIKEVWMHAPTEHDKRFKVAIHWKGGLMKDKDWVFVTGSEE